MAYVALYRAYRPQKFDEVVGQEHIIKTLKNAIKLNKVAHAYLFCGPRGTGKTTMAKIVAKAMNCVNGPTTDPCCECEICQGIAKGTIPDVIEIDAASNNGADDIRDLRDTVKYLPSVGKYKVYIIDEVHMLSNAAFNALLKTLEEPPHHVIFILCTTEPYKLPATILSRCQRFDFKSIQIDEILKRLKIVSESEGLKVTDDALHQVATSAEGGMRDALSLFDQAISYSVGEEVTLDDVLAVSGNISYLKLIELLSSCISKDESNALSVLDSIIKDGKEITRIVNDAIMFLRDTLMYQNDSIIEENPMFNNDSFKELSKKLPKKVIYQWLDILNECNNEMRFSTRKRAYLELAILKMNDTKLNEEANMQDKIENLEAAINMLTQKVRDLEVNGVKSNGLKQQSYRPNIPSSDAFSKYNEPVRNIESEPKKVEVPIEPKVENTSKENDYVEDNKPNIINENTNVENKQIVENVPQIAKNVSDEVTISDVEEILYHASKEQKEALNKIWNEISINYPNEFTIQILVHGKIVAVSDKSFIVVLQDKAFCNRVMLYQSYVKIMEIFNELGIGLTDYICIPVEVWREIITDYKSKYSPNNRYPSLKEINIGVKKRIIPTAEEEKEDPMVAGVKELVDNVRILED